MPGPPREPARHTRRPGVRQTTPAGRAGPDGGAARRRGLGGAVRRGASRRGARTWRGARRGGGGEGWRGTRGYGRARGGATPGRGRGGEGRGGGEGGLLLAPAERVSHRQVAPLRRRPRAKLLGGHLSRAPLARSTPRRNAGDGGRSLELVGQRGKLPESAGGRRGWWAGAREATPPGPNPQPSAAAAGRGRAARRAAARPRSPRGTARSGRPGAAAGARARCPRSARRDGSGWPRGRASATARLRRRRRLRPSAIGARAAPVG